MSIDYAQLKSLVKEAMFTGGGINLPSAPEGIPHRMPSADTWDKEQDMGDPEANELYAVALTAREATEQLVEALDEPVYDEAYEHAFKASASLRRALNSLESSGAHPMPIQRVVAPPTNQQKYNAGSYAGENSAGAGLGSAIPMGDGLAEADKQLGLPGVDDPEAQLKGMGTKRMSQTKHGREELERSKSLASGETLKGIDDRERAMLVQIEKVLSTVADEADLIQFRPQIQIILKNLLKQAAKTKAKNKQLDLPGTRK